jgi:hypothetical protein
MIPSTSVHKDARPVNCICAIHYYYLPEVCIRKGIRIGKRMTVLSKEQTKQNGKQAAVNLSCGTNV